MKKILEVKNVFKIYKIYRKNTDRLKELFFNKLYHKEFVANKDVSFELFEGETLGIIGINGAGKSTILKMIAGVIEPSSGNIIRNGRVTALLELGTGFNSQMSGFDNIYLNGTLIGMSAKEIDKKIEKIIEFSELGDYIYEPIITYSSGMSMRLAFSIAIYSEPQILIVDEALSVGDAHFGAKCTRALRERKEKKMSIIYVSHDLNSLKLLCDRVVLLNHGEVAKEGNPEDVINSYNFLIAKLNDTEEKMSIGNLENSSFGTFDVEITNVTIEGEKSNSNVISSGENANINILLKSNIDIKNVNIGILIRDKFGQDIFGVSSEKLNTNYDFEKNCKYKIVFIIPLSITSGKYSISTAIAVGETHLEHCLHWLDNACGFEIAGNLGSDFVGLCKLYPTLHKIEKINNDK